MMKTTTATTRAKGSKLGAILRVTSGNFLEQFDFFLFGFYATYISRTFFPATSEFASLMMTFAVFGSGFLMRPLGAIVLGAYIDKVGRRKGLIVTLSIMAAGTVLIALVPGYAAIGVAAPILVLLGRLLQGFSAGAEMGGVSVYLAEILFCQQSSLPPFHSYNPALSIHGWHWLYFRIVHKSVRKFRNRYNSQGPLLSVHSCFHPRASFQH